MPKTHPIWFEQRTKDAWQCTLCPHQCLLQEGSVGHCQMRTVHKGIPVDLSYGRVSAQQLDPIEKKPLYHFYPSSMVYSIGGYGCNFRCSFCQNWHIAQCSSHSQSAKYTPSDIVTAALRSNATGIAYTYNEPIISYPFVYETAVCAREAGLCNILVTNGYIQQEPAASLLTVIDAINLDIKSMQDTFYRTFCGGRLDPVLAFAKQAKETKIHLEITNLLIPDLNDSPAEIEQLAQWVAHELSPQTVLHLSAYHPAYQMHTPATDSPIVRHAQQVARRYLAYVYCGNIPDIDNSQDTHCTACGNCLIKRKHWETHVVGLTNQSHCQTCGRPSQIPLHRP